MINTLFKDRFSTYDRRDCVIISSIDWSCNWQIHQQLATSLVKSGHRVLFIENTGARGPRSGDFGRICDRVRNWLKSTRGFFDASENLTVFSPIFIPFPYSRLALFINRYLLSSVIGKWMRISRFHSPVIISFLPTPLSQLLIEDINPSLVVYYCADDMSGRSEGAARLKTYEDSFFSKVDAVFCSSHSLLEYAERFNRHVFLFPAGVDFHKFEAAREDGKVAVELSDLSKPVIGYVGAISTVFDQMLLVHAAHSLPEASFVLIGPEFTDLSLLKACPNIKLLGMRPHGDVPGYILGFDIALIPYVNNAFTDAVYSCKLNEYLAMGVPVVATDMRELRFYVEHHGNVLYIAKTREEFVEKIRQALAAPDNANRLARISAARENSWDQRFENICGVIGQLLEEKEAVGISWQIRLISFYRRGRMRVIKFWLILATCYAVIFYTPLLWFAGDMLVMRGVPTVADVIVVFSGDGDPGYMNQSYQKREVDALALYRAKYSSRILLSSGKGQTISDAEVVRALLLEHGVPSGAIAMVEKMPRSTSENVQLTTEQLERDGAHKILFVTAPYHSRRAYLTWKKFAPELEVSTISVIDTPSEQPRWQISFSMAKVIAYEYLAIAYYWWKGWI
jgi:glycosyltransferase involved in cell wall biosynthesis/uncharacterized SAM-binding protein YcdF (DUF218 family)